MDPTQFLGIPSPGLDAADALILPWPLEKTVSYGTGTHSGPAAIVAASRQIELFEEETLIDFEVRPRLHTLDADRGRCRRAKVPAADRLPEHLAAAARTIARFRHPQAGTGSSSPLAANTC